MARSIAITDQSPATDRDRRERLGASVDDLAALAGITPQELTTYELAKSEADANPALAMKIRDALDAMEQQAEGDGDAPEAHPT